MKGLIVPILLVSAGLLEHASCVAHRYHYVNEAMSWADARRYCRGNHTDLATVDNAKDANELFRTVGDRNATDDVWIGLYDDFYTWEWSMPGRGSRFRYWFPGQPFMSKQHCVVMCVNQQWAQWLCESKLPFVCATGNATFVYVPTPMNWSVAQSYCRDNHVDLVTIKNVNQNQVIQRMMVSGNDRIWIGLYRDPWTSWSDGSRSSFRYWKPGAPDNALGKENCTAMSPSGGGRWDDRDSGSKLTFVCYTTVPSVSRQFRVRLDPKDSNVNLNDLAVPEAILEQLHQRLRDQGVTEDVRLTWSERRDGRVFHQDEGHAGM